MKNETKFQKDPEGYSGIHVMFTNVHGYNFGFIKGSYQPCTVFV